MKGQNYIVFHVWALGQKKFKMISIQLSKIRKNRTSHLVGKCSKNYHSLFDLENVMSQGSN